MLKVSKSNSVSFKRKVWIYDKGNYQQYNEKLAAVDWDYLFECENEIEGKVGALTDKLLKAASETIPNKTITVRQNDLPWINNDIRKLIRKRDRIRKKAKKFDN